MLSSSLTGVPTLLADFFGSMTGSSGRAAGMRLAEAGHCLANRIGAE
ncbi:MAG: hypothetical protein OXC98_03975 [bacterium]|nr:hypothetical protein [bacterium]